jgi:NTE family protein
MSIPKVAIACQGGGSHAAFAAGVLTGLFSSEQQQRFELVALSGSSGGAMCASLLWRGLVSSGPREAVERLLAFWRDLEVHDWADAISNFWSVWWSRMPVTVDLNPYLYEPSAEPTLRRLLSKHLDLEHLNGVRNRPQLLIGATDVLCGDRVIYTGEGLSYDGVIASAAVPPLFRAVKAGQHLCWDGLFTTNPPVREFTDLDPRPDEIWLVQINPQRRAREPRSLQEINDRRNELSGNLSLGQELFFVQRINHLLEAYPVLAERYQPIRIRVVELAGSELDYPSKLDRNPAFIEQLIERGIQSAEAFFDGRSEWPRAFSTPARSVIATAAE